MSAIHLKDGVLTLDVSKVASSEQGQRVLKQIQSIKTDSPMPVTLTDEEYEELVTDEVATMTLQEAYELRDKYARKLELQLEEAKAWQKEARELLREAWFRNKPLDDRCDALLEGGDE